VTALLAKIANMRATSFVEASSKTGLRQPAMVVSVKFDRCKKEERVTFGKSGEDVFAARPASSGA